MKQINLRALMFLPFAAIGPIVTVYLIWQGKNYSTDALLPAIAVAGIFIVITAIAAFIVRKIYPSAEGTTGKTIGVSYIFTMVTVAAFSYRDALFAVALIFAPIFASPTILPFSLLWSELLRPSERDTTNDINKTKSPLKKHEDA